MSRGTLWALLPLGVACRPSAADAPAGTGCAKADFDVCVTQCERDDVVACQGIAAECIGSELPRCKKAAQPARERACALGSASGCLMAVDGFTEREREDVHRVLELLDRACSLGETRGCTRGLLAHGHAMDPADDGNWVELRRRAKLTCDAGEILGCAALADLWALGLGGRRDSERALELDGRACEQEVEAACHNANTPASRFTTVIAPLFERKNDPFPTDAFSSKRLRYYAEMEARASLRVCVDASSTTPSDAVVVAASEFEAFDRSLAVGVRGWEMRRSPRLPGDIAVCPYYTFAVVEDTLGGHSIEIVPFLPAAGW
ncbi:MAG: hypothetical protein AAF721_01370 [Myxococcota bacterium]